MKRAAEPIPDVAYWDRIAAHRATEWSKWNLESTRYEMEVSRRLAVEHRECSGICMARGWLDMAEGFCDFEDASRKEIEYLGSLMAKLAKKEKGDRR